MTVTMSVKKRTSPQEWIHDYFSPVLTVYANEVSFNIINQCVCIVEIYSEIYSELYNDHVDDVGCRVDSK